MSKSKNELVKEDLIKIQTHVNEINKIIKEKFMCHLVNVRQLNDKCISVEIYEKLSPVFL